MRKTGQGGWVSSAVWVGRCGLRSTGLPGAASLSIPATIQAIPTPLFSLTIKLAPLQASFRDSILNFIALLLLSQSRFLWHSVTREERRARRTFVEKSCGCRGGIAVKTQKNDGCEPANSTNNSWVVVGITYSVPSNICWRILLGRGLETQLSINSKNN